MSDALTDFQLSDYSYLRCCLHSIFDYRYYYYYRYSHLTSLSTFFHRVFFSISSILLSIFTSLHFSSLLICSFLFSSFFFFLTSWTNCLWLSTAEDWVVCALPLPILSKPLPLFHLL